MRVKETKKSYFGRLSTRASFVPVTKIGNATTIDITFEAIICGGNAASTTLATDAAVSAQKNHSTSRFSPFFER